jgi:hypothetical protein
MKPLYHLVLSIFLLGAASINAQAQEEAPLGLSWGITTSDLRARGVELTEYSGSQFGKSFVASKLEKAIADQDAALLSFGFNDKLWRIILLSREFSNDPFGSSVLARYNELTNVLSEKYGKPQQFHRLGQSIYSEQRYFLAGIRGGESSWFSDFDTPNLKIQLRISTNDSSTGRWQLIYEHKSLKKDFEASKRSREKGSL